MHPRQNPGYAYAREIIGNVTWSALEHSDINLLTLVVKACLLYTSDAADE